MNTNVNPFGKIENPKNVKWFKFSYKGLSNPYAIAEKVNAIPEGQPVIIIKSDGKKRTWLTKQEASPTNYTFTNLSNQKIKVDKGNIKEVYAIRGWLENVEPSEPMPVKITC